MINNSQRIRVLRTKIDNCNKENRQLATGLKHIKSASSKISNEIANVRKLHTELKSSFTISQKSVDGDQLITGPVSTLTNIKSQLDGSITAEINNEISKNNKLINEYEREIARLRAEENIQ